MLKTFVCSHSGHVEGTESGIFSAPKRDYDHTDSGFSSFIQQNWSDVSGGRLWVTKDYSATGAVGFIEDAAKAVLDVGAGAVGGTLGIVIGLGDEVGKVFGSLGIGETFGVVAASWSSLPAVRLRWPSSTALRSVRLQTP